MLRCISILANLCNTAFEPIKWETHCYPAAGTDAQAVVNSQIGNNYQVFIGILGRRFGTPTPRAESGTAEEFDRAYEKYKQDSNNLDIMVYFNRAPPASLDNLDLNQFGLVEAFREKLGGEGVLYWRYNNKEEFLSYVRGHLTRVMQKWEDKTKLKRSISIKVPANQLEEPSVKNDAAQIDDPGVIDLIELGEESFSDVKEIVQRMGEAITAIGQKMTERSKEVDIITSEGTTDIRRTKKVIDSAARDMESFALRMEVEIPLFSKSYYVGIDAYNRAISIYANELNRNEQESSKIQKNVRDLRQGIEQAMDSMIRFRDVVDHLPRVTTAFNKSKRHVVNVLDHLLKEFTAAKNLAYNIESIVEKIIEE